MSVLEFVLGLLMFKKYKVPFIARFFQGGTMRSLSSLWLYAALPGVLWASHVTLLVEGDNDASRICKPAPNWTIKGQAPMQELLGNVVVVALLKAS